MIAFAAGLLRLNFLRVAVALAAIVGFVRRPDPGGIRLSERPIADAGIAFWLFLPMAAWSVGRGGR